MGITESKRRFFCMKTQPEILPLKTNGISSYLMHAGAQYGAMVTGRMQRRRQYSNHACFNRYCVIGLLRPHNTARRFLQFDTRSVRCKSIGFGNENHTQPNINGDDDKMGKDASSRSQSPKQKGNLVSEPKRNATIESERYVAGDVRESRRPMDLPRKRENKNNGEMNVDRQPWGGMWKRIREILQPRRLAFAVVQGALLFGLVKAICSPAETKSKDVMHTHSPSTSAQSVHSSSTTVVNSAYSNFMKSVQQNDVAWVNVDDVHITYGKKSDGWVIRGNNAKPEITSLSSDVNQNVSFLIPLRIYLFNYTS